MTAKFYPEKLIAAFNKATETALTMIGMQIKAESMRNLTTARDTGRLVNSIGFEVKTGGVNIGGKNTVNVGTNVNYAQYVEFGSGPHRRDMRSEEFKKNMAGWFRRHGIYDKTIQFLILRKIRKHGTLARPYLRPALDKVKPQMERMVAVAFKDMIARGKK